MFCVVSGSEFSLLVAFLEFFWQNSSHYFGFGFLMNA